MVQAKLATARALALADARAWALPDSTTFSNDSVVYEIVPGPDGALRPRKVPPRDHTSNLPPPPGMHRGKARARGAWPSGKLQAGGDGGGGGDDGGKARAYAPNDVRNPQHPNHTKMKNGAPRASRRGRPPRHIRRLNPAPVTPATPSASVPPTTPKPSATVTLVLEVTPAISSRGKQSSEQAISSKCIE